MELSEQKLLEEKIKAERYCAIAAYWFILIAILTLVNSAALLFKGKVHFLIGLGISQFIDGIAIVAQGQAGGVIRAFAVLIDLLFVAIFAVFGLLARKRTAPG